MDPIYFYIQKYIPELRPRKFQIPTVSLSLKVPPLLLFLYVLMRAASVTEKAYMTHDQPAGNGHLKWWRFP